MVDFSGSAPRRDEPPAPLTAAGRIGALEAQVEALPARMEEAAG